ncbi:MAG: methyl-accepting chemotaxis protein [Candidatus Omnitrophota bacterium]
MDNGKGARGGYKRTQYFVATKFQTKYVGLILILMFLTAALCSYVIYYTTMVGMGEKLASVYPQGRLISIVKTVNIRILLATVFITPFVIIFGIYASHKIAGPIFRMEKFLNNVATGDLSTRLTLREKDELISLANGINNVLDSMRTTIIAEKAQIEKVSVEMSKLKKAVETEPTDQSIVKELVYRVSGGIDSLNGEVDKFKL